MKAGLFIAAVAQLAAAQPHIRHQHLHEKRDVVTKIDIVTATTPDVVVFVNQFGDPVSTSTVNAYLHHKWHTPTSASSVAEQTFASTRAESTYSVAPIESASVHSAPIETSTLVSIVASSSKTTSTAAAASSTSSGSTSSKYGLTYSPYNANGGCKTTSQVQADFEKLGNYGLVRLYATDCNQLNTVGPVAVANGAKLMLGVYDLSDLTTDIAEIVAFAAGNWDNIETVSIGNELINSGEATVAEVVTAVNTARALLKAAGFKGNVVTVDTFAAVLNNPELCEASDFAAINTHAFFNSETTAAEAGKFVSTVAAKVQSVCGKTAIVTESGWPSQGQSNGMAVPSVENQATAVASLRSAFESNPSNIVLFTAYNDLWKTNFDGSFGAEQYWGMYGTSNQ